MLKTQSINTNYLAQVVKLDQFEAIPKADKIKIAVVNYQRVITSANAEAGTLYIYFPLECCINKDYLSWSNSFSNANLNADPSQKGFFDNNGRVRAIKLRGIMSEGYIVPIGTVVDWWNSDKERVKKAPLKLSDFQTNQTFDTIGSLLLCEKYVPKVQQNREANEARCVANKKGKVKRHNKLIDNQFRFHTETAQLKRNLHKLEPDDIITISEKLHGCVDRSTIIDTLELGPIAIGKIVDEKLHVKVKAFDTTKQQIVYVDIDNYYFYPNDDDWYEIELEDGRKIEITGNNPVWMPELQCYRSVEKLLQGDLLLID